MAIKTIEDPRQIKSFQLRCDTKNCQALLEMRFSDGGVTIEGGTKYFTFKCPHCDKSTMTIYDKIKIDFYPSSEELAGE